MLTAPFHLPHTQAVQPLLRTCLAIISLFISSQPSEQGSYCDYEVRLQISPSTNESAPVTVWIPDREVALQVDVGE